MHKQASSTRRRWIIAFCWLTVVFEGFDIVALGAAIPTLLDTPARCSCGGIVPLVTSVTR